LPEKKLEPLEYEIKEDDLIYFLHIPKTAGTTFIAILDSYFDLNSIYSKKVWHELLKNIPEKFNYKLLRGHLGFNVNAVTHKEPITLTILREPIERTISQYEHIRRDPTGNNWVGKNFFSSKESITNIFANEDKRQVFTNVQTRYLGLDFDVIEKTNSFGSKSMRNFRFDQNLSSMQEGMSDENLLETAKKRLANFVFVGLAEKFDESLFLLYYTFGWRPMDINWKLNVSPKRKHHKDLSKKTLSIVRDCNKLDIKLYNYGKKIFENRFSKMVEDLKEKYNEKSFEKLPFKDMIFNMLEKHYEYRFNESHIKPVKSIDYDFGQKISGSGWYFRELKKNGRVYRWTGPGTTSTIDFPLDIREDMVVLFHIFLAPAPDVIDSVKLMVNEQPINLKLAYRKREERYYEATIPKSVLSLGKNFTRFTFKVNRTINPHLVDPKDTLDRYIGLGFDKIKIIPQSVYNSTKQVIAIDHKTPSTKEDLQLIAKLNRMTRQNQKLIKKISS